MQVVWKVGWDISAKGKKELLLLVPVTKKEVIRGSLDVFRIFIEVYYTYRKDTYH